MKTNKTKLDTTALLAVSEICECSDVYVRMVLNGDRKNNSDRAKMIVATYEKYVKEMKRVRNEVRKIPAEYNRAKQKVLRQLVNS